MLLEASVCAYQFQRGYTKTHRVGRIDDKVPKESTLVFRETRLPSTIGLVECSRRLRGPSDQKVVWFLNFGIGSKQFGRRCAYFPCRELRNGSPRFRNKGP